MNSKKQIADWLESKRVAKLAAERELELRNKLIASLFDEAVIEGTETKQIGELKLTCTKRLNYSVNKKKAQALAADPAYADLFSWSPSLVISEYRKSQYRVTANDAEFMRNMQEAVTIKPGQPSLEVK